MKPDEPREVRNVLCVGNRGVAACERALDALLGQLEESGLSVDEGVAAFERRRPDIILVLGGDGFLMETLRHLGYPDVPIIPPAKIEYDESPAED